MQREYVLEKLSINKLNPTKAKQQLHTIRKDCEANTTLGVTARIRGRVKPEVISQNAFNFKYTFKVMLSKDGQNAEEALDLVEQTLRASAKLQKWTVLGESSTVAAMAAQTKARPPFVLRELDEVTLRSEFPDIIGRDAYLRTIHQATQMYVKSAGQVRSHSILYGVPGAAKTSMLLRLKDFYERDSEVERVHAIDATAITKAGLENYILDKADAGELAEILYIEEIEKYDMNVLLPLGSLMDGRGVLTKLNARVDRSAKANILVWMTCNDEEFVKKWHKGFIWSRCANKIPCVRPTRTEMEMEIMPKKIEQINGRQEWIKLACEFAYDVLKTDDPREVLACLDGMDRLIDGSYQKDRLKILHNAAGQHAGWRMKVDEFN